VDAPIWIDTGFVNGIFDQFTVQDGTLDLVGTTTGTISLLD